MTGRRTAFARGFLNAHGAPATFMEHLFERSRARLQALWQELHIPQREQDHFAKQFFEPPSAANHAHIALQVRSAFGSVVKGLSKDVNGSDVPFLCVHASVCVCLYGMEQISRLIEHRAATLHVLKCIDLREIYIGQLRELADLLSDARRGYHLPSSLAGWLVCRWGRSNATDRMVGGQAGRWMRVWWAKRWDRWCAICVGPPCRPWKPCRPGGYRSLVPFSLLIGIDAHHTCVCV